MLQLALAMGSPLKKSPGEQGWWAVKPGPSSSTPEEQSEFNPTTGRKRAKKDPTADEGFGRFGAEAFLYTSTDVANFDFPKLVDQVKYSLQLADELVKNGAFLKMAKEYAHGGSDRRDNPGADLRGHHQRVEP